MIRQALLWVELDPPQHQFIVHAGSGDTQVVVRAGDVVDISFHLTFSEEGVSVGMTMPDENGVIAWGD